MKIWILVIIAVLLYEGSCVVLNRIHSLSYDSSSIEISKLEQSLVELKPMMYRGDISKDEFDKVIRRKKEIDATLGPLMRQNERSKGIWKWTSSYSVSISWVLPLFGVDWMLHETLFGVCA